MVIENRLCTILFPTLSKIFTTMSLIFTTVSLMFSTLSKIDFVRSNKKEGRKKY